MSVFYPVFRKPLPPGTRQQKGFNFSLHFAASSELENSFSRVGLFHCQPNSPEDICGSVEMVALSGSPGL